MRIGVSARTLGKGKAAHADWQYLTARRFALFVVNSIERGTRWVATAPPHVEVAEMAAAQVRVHSSPRRCTRIKPSARCRCKTLFSCLRSAQRLHLV